MSKDTLGNDINDSLQCPYCKTDTCGNHDHNCPHSKAPLDAVIGTKGYIEAGLEVEKEENAAMRKQIATLEQELAEAKKNEEELVMKIAGMMDAEVDAKIATKAELAQKDVKLSFTFGVNKVLSGKVDKLKAELAEAKEFEKAVRDAHNGYDPNNDFPEPESPQQAIKDLNDEWDRMEDNYVEQIVNLKAELAKYRWRKVTEPPEYVEGLEQSMPILILDDRQVVIGKYSRGLFEWWSGTFRNIDEPGSQQSINGWMPIPDPCAF